MPVGCVDLSRAVKPAGSGQSVTVRVTQCRSASARSLGSEAGREPRGRAPGRAGQKIGNLCRVVWPRAVRAGGAPRVLVYIYRCTGAL